MAIGNATDFLVMVTDLGVTISRTPVTIEEDNVTGDRNETEGSTANFTAILENDKSFYSLTNSGLQEGADVRLFFKATDTLNKDDKLTFGGVDYKVETVDPRYDSDGTLAHQIALLFKI